MLKSILLTGMSQVGKSNLAERIEKEVHGFARVCCDDEIERRLGPQLSALGYAGIKDVAKWMGQPFDARYAKNSAEYLAHERVVMMEVIERLTRGEKLVVDTTGSVIYTGPEILKKLRSLSVVILMNAGPEHERELYRKYLEEPKPVIWGDNTYKPRKDEEPLSALGRCYPELLRTRNVHYKNFAHLPFGYREFRKPEFSVEKFVQNIAV